MKNFEIFFELYGKKMKTIIVANNETDAKKNVQDNIIFYKIIEKVDDKKDIKDFMGNNDSFNKLMDIFGMNNKK